MTPAWISEAKNYIGLKEIKGLSTNLTIKAWLQKLKAWWSDDETAWCGTFVAHCMQVAGVPLPKNWYRAKDWLTWGVAVQSPLVGCVVVFERVGGGHVGFVVGKDTRGRLMVLGGNQGDAVSVVPFDESRVAGYRIPLGAVGLSSTLPLFDASRLASSSKES